MRIVCHRTSTCHGLLALLIITAVLASVGVADEVRHWAFRSLQGPSLPVVKDGSRVRSPIDRFVQAKLEANGLTLSSEADRPTLIRRVAFDLTGLPPTPSDIAEFVVDPSPVAYERMIERYLASPSYGEKWGKWWLDVAGYADSNGYFQADSDRPLAFRYRDYVIRSLNADKPFDQFVREQIAGDELSGFDPQQHERHATPQMIELLEATHFLRNGIDGSGESDGNPEEVLIDRYTALEASQQILISSLLGLTIQCAKCHDHKFEPITQREYYQLQASLFPVFNLQKWLKPSERFTNANLPGEVEAWEQRQKELDGQLAALRSDFGRWVREHFPPAGVLFHDDFDGPVGTFAANWSNTAPGDDAPGGTAVVKLVQGSEPAKVEPPAAVRTAGVLRIVEGGIAGDKWLSTTRTFDWTPDKPGEWIQATFDVVDNKVQADEVPAARIAFFLALHDFNDNSQVPGGNILIDGNPAGGAVVYVDYPGSDETQRGAIGTSGFLPGKNFGARITRLDNGKFKLEQIVDWVPEDKSLELTADELPDGGFGFEFCCGRSFIVDNVVIQSSSGNAADDATQAELKKFREDYDSRRKTLADAASELQVQHNPPLGKIAWASDVLPDPPEVRMLVRGNVMTPGELVQPATFHALTDDADSVGRIANPSHDRPATRTTGRRLALADWLTRRDSRVAALMARVQVNRIWQQYFSRGIVSTVDNLGVSSSPPSHPELLEWLAAEFVGQAFQPDPKVPTESATDRVRLESLTYGTWDIKHLQRLIVTSATYRQTSEHLPGDPQPAIRDQKSRDPKSLDPDNHWLWRAPMRRLNAEAIRDGMLFVSGGLDRRLFGPYVPTKRTSAAEVVVDESLPGARRRSMYLQQRRTQTLSLLSFFDAPSIVSNCVQRPTTTMPLQSLSLLNSEFALSRAREFATRLEQESPPDPRRRARFAFELSAGRLPTDAELRQSLQFLEEQTRSYEPAVEASQRAWADFCQMLLAANGFLYVE